MLTKRYAVGSSRARGSGSKSVKPSQQAIAQGFTLADQNGEAVARAGGGLWRWRMAVGGELRVERQESAAVGFRNLFIRRSRRARLGGTGDGEQAGM